MNESREAGWVREALAAARLPARARVGCLGPRAAELADVVRLLGHEPVAIAPDSGGPAAPDLDAVAAVDALEAFEWDAWLLRELRTRLRTGGTLVLVARNLTSLAGAGDVAWLARRIAREAAARLGRRLGARAPAFAGRRYAAGRLRRLLDAAGFEAIALAPRGAGFTAPLAARVPGARRLSRAWQVTARAREPNRFGGPVRLAAPDAHRAAFEREHARFVRDRDAWAARHAGQYDPAPVALDPARFADARVLVLAPHPDDELIGCGGLALRLEDAGARVTCIQATDGSDSHALKDRPESERRGARVAEARDIAAAAGFAAEFWNADNHAFRPTAELVERLARRIADDRPRLILTPFLTDIHPDHLTLNRILADAIERLPDAVRDTEVLGYEVWSLAPANRVCEVTGVRERQEALLRRYVTAMKVEDFVEFCERRNFYEGCRMLGRPALAEAFLAAPAAAWPGWVREAAAVTSAAP